MFDLINTKTIFLYNSPNNASYLLWFSCITHQYHTVLAIKSIHDRWGNCQPCKSTVTISVFLSGECFYTCKPVFQSCQVNPCKSIYHAFRESKFKLTLLHLIISPILSLLFQIDSVILWLFILVFLWETWSNLTCEGPSCVIRDAGSKYAVTRLRTSRHCKAGLKSFPTVYNMPI